MSISYEVSRDPAMLQQYYDLRQRCFREELKLPDFDGSEEDRDREARILLAIKDNRCIGGVRICADLPDELRSEDIHSQVCCIWERFVVDPSTRTIDIIREFVSHLIKLSADFGYTHALVLSSLRNARFYRQCHSALGAGFQILRRAPEFAHGSFEGLEHYLSVSTLREGQALQLAA